MDMTIALTEPKLSLKASSGFSIADPSDMLSLDVTGFDTNAPSVIAEFY